MNPLISFVVPAAAVGQPLTQTGSPGLPAHPFVCTDYTQGEVFVIYRSGESEWSYPAERCNDIRSLTNGNTPIACSDHKGDPRIVEVDASKALTWQLTKDELPGIELRFMTGMQCLPPW